MSVMLFTGMGDAFRKPGVLNKRRIITEVFHRNDTVNIYLNNLEKMSKGRGKSISYIESINRKIERRISIPIPIMSIGSDDKKTTIWDKIRQEEKISSEKTSNTGVFRMESDTHLYNFTRIGGYDHVKKELSQVAHMMIHPEEYTRYNVRTPRGVLLEGPPGNGKTLLAKCFAGETKANFIQCSGSNFNEKYIGVGSSRVRELFQFATENAPAVLFIDEFDAIGRSRGGSEDSSGGERDTTLNQLLVLMDGFDKEKNILVIGATNRIDILDKAATRPGRFDKIIHIQNPDSDTRREIIDIHIRNKPFEVEKDTIVRMTAGYSGAMIENLLNEATLWGIRNNALPVRHDDLDNIRQRMIFGVATEKRNMSDAILKRIAIHESGHLINALVSDYYEQPIRVSIESGGVQSLGMTVFQKEEVDDGIFIRDYLDEKIRVLLGGRAAEEIIYGHSVSSGSVSDLETAFQLIKRMILEFGMGNDIVYPFLSEEYKKRIDDEIHEYIKIAYNNAKDVLVENIDLLHVFVSRLLEQHTLTEQDIRDILIETPCKK